MTKQWFKVIKFSGKESAEVSKKCDICCIEANSTDEAYNNLINQLATRHYVKCEFFSEGKTYPRSIGQIIDFIPISDQEALQKQEYFKSAM